ncbi:hypothetical protein GYMLUDRAFT_80188 [Collybiopsis luxurians FD-317 M1]|nr:hypothetical protein GYMLUDRAFT_80188 [Collybiopsis luxurians FD-317 M1]
MVRLTALSYVAFISSVCHPSMAAGVPSRRAMAVHESRTLPPYFTSSGTPDPDTPINLIIALTAQNMAGLKQTLQEVSDPTSPSYGQYLSYEETKAFASPKPDTVAAVTAWLNQNGIKDITTTGAFGNRLAFTVPISAANSLLDADYQDYTEIGGSTQLTRTLAYSIPADLKDNIDVVYPSTDFVRNIQLPIFQIPVPTPSNNTARAPDPSCDTEVTPTCLQELYGIPTAKANQTSNVLAVPGFLNEWAQTADLELFLENFRTDIPSTTTFTLQTLDGGSNPQGPGNAGIEANLDIQYTVGVATGVPVTFISVGRNDSIAFLDLIDSINQQDSPPHVLTTSYGFNENDITSALANVLCNNYMLAGTRGISVLFSSGDGGVSGSQNQSCTNFVPTFPSSCPYVTSVGATTQVSAETAASLSSGGFSNIFPRPSYQNNDVTNYLTTLGSTNAGKFNPNGRAFPDVAAIGQHLVVFNGGQEFLVDGTSASSPIFASMIALINDELIAAGKSLLGFLNPLLYANPGALNDITTGDNPGCGTNGFLAGAGWDPVTGLGTPNYANLRTLVGL